MSTVIEKSGENARFARMKNWHACWPGQLLNVPATSESPRRIRLETWLLLGLSLGASGIWAALSLLRTWLESLAAHQSLSARTSTLNGSSTNLAWLDFIYQVTQIALGVLPAAFAIYLLGGSIRKPLQYLGIDRTRLVPDAVLGALLAAAIGIPGLGLYAAARAIGVNTTVVASGLGSHWWSIPVLIAAACENAILEEVVMIGYLFTRWSQSGWGRTRVIVTSALIRGSYHLYQGLGGFIGNVIMGMIFGWVYVRCRRVLPLIVTHTILDVVSFVGYQLLASHVHWL